VIDYGAPYIIKHNTGPLFTYIRYPLAGNELDEEIITWVYDMYRSKLFAFDLVLADNSWAEGKLNVNFDSFLHDNRYAGIVLFGSYDHDGLEQPQEVLTTFNFDLIQRVRLANDQIIDPNRYQEVLDLLAEVIKQDFPDTREHLQDMDSSWLEHLVLGREELIVVLERSYILPSYYSTLRVKLPYAQLTESLLLEVEASLADVPGNPGRPFPGTSLEFLGTPRTPGEVINLTARDYIDPALPMLALTFDDGPSQFTSHILDILERFQVRATFFVIGNLVNSRSEVVVRAVELGNEVAGHSWDHSDFTRLTDADIRRQILDTSAVIEAVTGVAPPFFRPPCGAVNDNMLQV